MGRGIEPHPVAGPAEQGQQAHGDRTLAVGARHMHDPHLFLGLAQAVEKGGHAVEAKLDLEKLQVVQELPGFTKVHQPMISSLA